MINEQIYTQSIASSMERTPVLDSHDHFLFTQEILDEIVKRPKTIFVCTRIYYPNVTRKKNCTQSHFSNAV